MKEYRAGVDIGSTTVKLVLMDEAGEMVFGQYRRHHAHTQQTLAQLLHDAREQVGQCTLRIKITGSGAIGVGRALELPFVQEVVATCAGRRGRQDHLF